LALLVGAIDLLSERTAAAAPSKENLWYSIPPGFARDHPSWGDTHMIKRCKFLSNYAEDRLLISLVVIGAMGLYMFTAHFIIAGLL
jgi:hypothetical protein